MTLIVASQIISKASSAIIVNPRKEILMLLRDDMPLWTDVGGMVEEGESFLEALHRETLEEVNLTIQVEKFIGNFYSFLKEEQYRQVQVFLCSIVDQQIPVVKHEGIKCAWFKANALPFNIAPQYRARIEYALKANNFTPAEQILRLGDSISFLKKISDFSVFYDIKEWLVHPKVQQKRQAKTLRFNPEGHFSLKEINQCV